jgi:hypothetical protein
LLADAINATQKTVVRAKTEVDKKLDQVRQSIHEATAPKPPHTGKSAQSKGKTSRRRSSQRRNTKSTDMPPNPEPTN